MLPFAALALASQATALAAHSALDTTGRSLIVRSEQDATPCMAEAYYGSYGAARDRVEHIYLPPRDCVKELAEDATSYSVTPFGRLVWVGLAGVDPSLVDLDMDQSWEFIQGLAEQHSASLLSGSGGHAQHTFMPTGHIYLVRQTPTSLLLHVPDAYVPILDTLLPAHLVPVALPRHPLPRSSSDSVHADGEMESEAWEPVPRRFADHLANLTKHLRFDPVLGEILDEGIQHDSIRRNVRWLTGEAPSGIESRHSFTAGAIKAAHWIKDKVESSGAVCDLHTYMPGFSPNVICTYPSTLNSDEHVILSAHYDSRGSFGNTRAPGGNDDGSGTGHLLAVVEAIKQGQVQFEKKVQVAFFSGEEQGLYGSHAYAQFLHNTNETVILHVQADMLGYHGAGEPMQLGLPETIGTPEAAYLLGNLSHLYSPELVVGRTSACCSDHQSFHAYGFPATQVYERNGWILDPMYHNSGDISQRDGYDFDQIVSIAKVTMSAILTVGGYKVVV